MAKRRGEAINGWIVIDKPAGVTSAGVVAKAKAITRAAKVGHGGTLDPLATGVLPLALGEATKTVAYVMEGTKTYRFSVSWGERRTTDDADGEVVETSPVRPTEAAIEAALPAFTGAVEQVPPDFSAIKVGGKRAYDLARADTPVDLAPRTVQVSAFRLLDVIDTDHATFEVVAGKGAYMRSLGRDLAAALGTVGHIVDLRRTSVGQFGENRAISLDKLAALRHSARLDECLLPVATALDDIPVLALTETEARRLQRGQPIAALPVVSRSPLTEDPREAVFCAKSGTRPVALARIEGGEIRPVRVLNL